MSFQEWCVAIDSRRLIRVVGRRVAVAIAVSGGNSVAQSHIARAAIAAFSAPLAKMVITSVFCAVDANFLRRAATNRANESAGFH